MRCVNNLKPRRPRSGEETCDIRNEIHFLELAGETTIGLAFGRKKIVQKIVFVYRLTVRV